jgi:hypothetical protein
MDLIPSQALANVHLAQPSCLMWPSHDCVANRAELYRSCGSHDSSGLATRSDVTEDEKGIDSREIADNSCDILSDTRSPRSCRMPTLGIGPGVLRSNVSIGKEENSLHPLSEFRVAPGSRLLGSRLLLRRRFRRIWNLSNLALSPRALHTHRVVPLPSEHLQQALLHRKSFRIRPSPYHHAGHMSTGG